MKTKMKKIWAITMVLGLLLSVLPFSANAASFSPRLSAPTYSGYYAPQSSYNPFKVNYNAYGGNCTWYAWGRAYEIMGSYPKLGTGNAGTWWSYNKNGGYYAYGSTPKLGAIACWSNSGAGHVAVVEQINSDGTIVISESGWTSCYFRTVTIPASGYRSGINFQGYIYLGNYTLDSANPTVSDVFVSNISSESFTINCTLNDDVGVTRVWLNVYGPGGEKGYAVEAQNGSFSHTISTSDYGGAGEYSVHVYAMDAAGNSTPYVINDIWAITDDTAPVITDVFTSNLSGDSFTINCTLNDNTGVTRVWLNVYGPSAEKGYAVEAQNGSFSHTISTSDYGGAGEYSVHIYAMDDVGNSTRYAINDIWAITDDTAPVITDVFTSNLSGNSFTINCTLNDNIGVTRVWLNVYGPSAEKGYAVEAQNGNFSHTISTSDYGGAGEYSVHVYAMDAAGNSTRYAINDIWAINTYILTYNANGGSGAPASQSGATNYTVSSVKPTRSGYTFLGWSTNSNATVASYVGGNSIALTVDTTLYAVWQKNVVATYTLSYNANGGSGAPASQSGATGYTINSTQPTRSGYTFLGWSKSSSATTASYTAGDSITLTANTTLYAVWQKNAVVPTPDEPTPTPTELPEIKINRTSTTAINYGDTLVLTLDEIEIPEGYAVEWFVEGAGVSTWVSEDGMECRVTSIANGNATIYAKLVDADENAVTNADGEEIFDEITVISKAGFFQKFVSFFKNLFGINRVIY